MDCNGIAEQCLCTVITEISVHMLDQVLNIIPSSIACLLERQSFSECTKINLLCAAERGSEHVYVLIKKIEMES